LKTESLPIGDIIISDGKDDILIIERKSVNDLLASIKDGRYEEQSYRLNGLNHHNHNIIYLIEGDVNKVNKFKNDTKIEKLTLYSAMFSLNYYKGFSVFRSFAIDETATIICNMAYKMQKDLANKKPYYSNAIIEDKINEVVVSEVVEDDKVTEVAEVVEEKNVCEDSDKNYVSVIKKVKKDNITTENIGEIMLCQIPGISSVTAIAVLEKYKSISNLIKELETNKDTLKDLTYTNSKGQTRKISKTCLSNIVKYLI
jgi:ERCC4-type nuclease